MRNITLGPRGHEYSQTQWLWLQERKNTGIMTLRVTERPRTPINLHG